MDPIPARKLSYVHRGGDVPLIGVTIDACFREIVERFGDQEAVVSVPQGHRLRYRELDREVQRLARGLLSLGVLSGDRVGIWSTDNLEWVLLQLATARVGAVLVNVNPAYRVTEVEHALKLARVQILFLEPSFRSSDYVGMLEEVRPRLPDLRDVVLFDPEGSGIERESSFLPWPELLAQGESVPSADVWARGQTLDCDDSINIQFTSGTTGSPKAVVLTHRNILNNGYFVGNTMGFTERDRLCVPVPFYHCFGMVVSNLACLTHGATIVIPARHFDAGATLHAIETERCTAVHGVPTMFVAELEVLRETPHDLSSLRTGIMAGAPCPPELIRRVMEEMGCREILVGYGQTEASPVTHATLPSDSFERRTQTVGTNLPHQEVKVVDPESDRVLPLGESGEVCFRGYHVMRGYFDAPIKTKDAIDPEGWLHSGDLGSLDGAGYLRITGRLKDIIIRGGENIDPAEIEAFYFDHPKISEIAVFGLPDARMGEEVAAWVRIRPHETATPEEFRTYASERIAHYKIPRYFWIVDEFPMTVTGKIQKFRMREIASRWLEKERD